MRTLKIFTYFFLASFLFFDARAGVLDNITGKTRRQVVSTLSKLASTVELWIINQQMLDMRRKIMGGHQQKVALQSFDKGAGKDKKGHKKSHLPQSAQGYFETSAQSQDPEAPTQVDLLNEREKHLSRHSATSRGVSTIQREADNLVAKFTQELQDALVSMKAEKEVLEENLEKAKTTKTDPGWFMQYGATVAEKLGGLGSTLSSAMQGLEDSSEKRKMEKVGELSTKLSKAVAEIQSLEAKIRNVKTNNEYREKKAKLTAKVSRLHSNLADVQRQIDQVFSTLLLTYGDDAERLAKKRVQLIHATGCHGDTNEKLGACAADYGAFLKKKLPKAKWPSCSFLYAEGEEIVDKEGNIRHPLELLEMIHQCQLDYLTKYACKKQDLKSEVCREKIVKMIQKKLSKIRKKLGKNVAEKCERITAKSGLTADAVQCLALSASEGWS